MATRYSSRRAKHMERYVSVKRVDRATYQLVLCVDHQTFHFPILATNAHEAKWMRNMLCIALDRMAACERQLKPDATPAGACGGPQGVV